jgi:hypothetical protein
MRIALFESRSKLFLYLLIGMILDVSGPVISANPHLKRVGNDIAVDSLIEPAFSEKLDFAKNRSIPLMDLHVHLKGGLTLEEALKNARKYGFTYGIAYNCGLKMGFESDDSLRTFVQNYKKPEGTYLAMQAEGREWLDMFRPETIDLFDYVFTDSMTWTNKNGKRMRLWIPEETEIGDPQDFMDQLVENIEAILDSEPIDIYVNATYLPDAISANYDELWTPERMDRVIRALKRNKVAMEISARYKIPSEDFIKRAKAGGVKFTFGTNNTGADDLGRLEYCLDMIRNCDLNKGDVWVP